MIIVFFTTALKSLKMLPCVESFSDGRISFCNYSRVANISLAAEKLITRRYRNVSAIEFLTEDLRICFLK